MTPAEAGREAMVDDPAIDDTSLTQGMCHGADSASRLGRTVAVSAIADIAVSKRVGLHVSWFVYRGSKSGVLQRRADCALGGHANGANSPWAPAWEPARDSR